MPPVTASHCCYVRRLASVRHLKQCDQSYSKGNFVLPHIMTNYPVAFDPAQNTAQLAGSQMVFHCHYYNCAIHKSIEKALGDRAASIFQNSALAAARPQLAALIEPEDAVITRLSKGITLFKQLGFGSFDTQGLSKTGGVVVSQSSHYALGWLSQYGMRAQPVCQFVEGYLQALVETTYDLDTHQVSVREEDCMATGAAECRFVVTIT